MLLQDSVPTVADSTFRHLIFARLDVFASKLGIAAGHIWYVLTRQAYAEAVMGLTNFVIWLVVYCLLFGWAKRAWKLWLDPAVGHRHTTDGQDANGIIATLAVLIGTVWGGVAINSLVNVVGYLVNPEYFAFQQLMRLFGAIK